VSGAHPLPRRARGGRHPCLTLPLFLSTVALACGAPKGPVERVTIPSGASLGVVADSLEAHHLVESRAWFVTLARLRRVDRSLQAGTYEVPAGSNAWRVLSILESGRTVTVRFTAPEGLTIVELALLAEEELHIPADSVAAAASDPAVRQEAGAIGPTVEGFLLPETYQLPLEVSGRALVRMMVEEFKRKWDPAWDQRLDSLGWTRHQALTLASIVEGEARHDDERPVIAGVYANRLKLGIPLQADPTVQYAIQLRTGQRKPRLYFRDYETNSPYNTYLHPGLPPGPVNSPGLASIRAALYPDKVPWLYFVAGPDGYHVFSRTLAEHNRAIEAVRKRKN
jgi:UPF0755 protein